MIVIVCLIAYASQKQQLDIILAAAGLPKLYYGDLLIVSTAVSIDSAVSYRSNAFSFYSHEHLGHMVVQGLQHRPSAAAAAAGCGHAGGEQVCLGHC